ncbi:hypothetical protein CEXT_479731, partial [Caerostris extrusa]
KVYPATVSGRRPAVSLRATLGENGGPVAPAIRVPRPIDPSGPLLPPSTTPSSKGWLPILFAVGTIEVEYCIIKVVWFHCCFYIGRFLCSALRRTFRNTRPREPYSIDPAPLKFFCCINTATRVESFWSFHGT